MTTMRSTVDVSRLGSLQGVRRWAGRTLLGLMAGAGGALVAQNTPVISGGVGFQSHTNGGANQFTPVIAPQFTSPIGPRLLLESSFYLGEGVARENCPPATTRGRSSIPPSICSWTTWHPGT